MPSRDSYLTFGIHKHRKLKDLPTHYLKWMSKNLIDTEFHEWALAAKEELETTRKYDSKWDDLEEQANQFLREHGVDPRAL